jgi:hypothetical protein
MLLALTYRQSKELIKQARWTPPTPKMKILGSGLQASRAAVMDRKAYQNLSLLSSSRQAWILLVMPILTD